MGGWSSFLLRLGLRLRSWERERERDSGRGRRRGWGEVERLPRCGETGTMTGDLPLLGITGGGVGARGNGRMTAGRSSLGPALCRTRYVFALDFRAVFDLNGFQSLKDTASCFGLLFL